MSDLTINREQAAPHIPKHKNISLTRDKCYRIPQFHKITSIKSTEEVQP